MRQDALNDDLNRDLNDALRDDDRRDRPPLAIVVKGYPRLSETFIAQEILELERRGFRIEIWSLRHPTDRALHPMHREIAAARRYLPEYLYQEPLRVLRGLVAGLGRRAFARLLPIFWRDLRRDPTPNRMRRLGQALVLARELDPAIRHLHVHYLHTPASVVRYACLLSGRSWSFSAHAKDIWTTPAWELAEKIAEARWGVTCTRAGLDELRARARPGDRERVGLVYHGLDRRRFPAPPQRPVRDGSDPADPVRIVSVGRMVGKKGFGDLIAALARLPAGLSWRFVHIGSGELGARLRELAASLGLGERVEFRGARPQQEVIAALREADLFVLPCKEGEAGDRDGLPNVIMEAATQGLPILSTRFAAVPEFLTDGRDGRLVPPGDVDALAAAIAELVRDPATRERLGAAAAERVAGAFSFELGIDAIAARLARSLGDPAAARA
jgi:glycosyltransferase involved in cell wall biosynthesis